MVTSLLLVEKFIEAEVVAQVSTSKILHCHEEKLPVLEIGFHVDDKGVAQLLQNWFLVNDWTHTLLEQYSKLLVTYFDFEIYFMAKICPVFFYSTFQTRPNPPEPTWYRSL